MYVLILNLNGMLIFNENKNELSMLKKNLSQSFDMKSVGNAKHALGMNITRDRGNICIYLSQFEYTPKILKRLNMESAKPFEHTVKSNFACKKRPWQIHKILRCIRIKHNMNVSRVKRQMKLKGCKVRGVFQK